MKEVIVISVVFFLGAIVGSVAAYLYAQLLVDLVKEEASKALADFRAEASKILAALQKKV